MLDDSSAKAEAEHAIAARARRQSAEPVGDLVAHALAEIGVTTVFGVISIHNMPILDAIARQQPHPLRAGAQRGRRHEHGRCLCARFPLAWRGHHQHRDGGGNAAGSQVEALTAGSPVLHVTSQIDRPYMDRDRAAIHDVPRQAGHAARDFQSLFPRMGGPHGRRHDRGGGAAALTPPRGPVSLEIPIDVQREKSRAPAADRGSAPIAPQMPDARLLDELRRLCARRGARCCGSAAARAKRALPARDLAERGFALVSSTNGRAVVPEAHPHTLGAYNMTPQAQAIYERADLMIVVGSRLRGNETRNNTARAAAAAGSDRCGTCAGCAQLCGRSVHLRRRPPCTR